MMIMIIVCTIRKSLNIIDNNYYKILKFLLLNKYLIIFLIISM